VCKIIIDGGSCHNLASKEIVDKLGLKLLKRPHPYHVQWLNNSGSIKIVQRVKVPFKIGEYIDTVKCDVAPMTVCICCWEDHGNMIGHLYIVVEPINTPLSGRARS
jgi:hypothetical protein